MIQTKLDTLAGLGGPALKLESESDAECLSLGVKGEIIVGFEHNHRLWRYLPGETLPQTLSQPAELSGLPPNNGFEGLSFAEGPENNKTTLAWVRDREGWPTMRYTVDDGLRSTGAATLQIGDILILERRFTLRGDVAGRIRRIHGSHIMPAAELVSTLVAEFRDLSITENFEGIAVRKGRNGSAIVYIILNDNFSALQRTLLMMFELKN